MLALHQFQYRLRRFFLQCHATPLTSIYKGSSLSSLTTYVCKVNFILFQQNEIPRIFAREYFFHHFSFEKLVPVKGRNLGEDFFTQIYSTLSTIWSNWKENPGKWRMEHMVLQLIAANFPKRTPIIHKFKMKCVFGSFTFDHLKNTSLPLFQLLWNNKFPGKIEFYLRLNANGPKMQKFPLKNSQFSYLLYISTKSKVAGGLWGLISWITLVNKPWMESLVVREWIFVFLIWPEWKAINRLNHRLAGFSQDIFKSEHPETEAYEHNVVYDFMFHTAQRLFYSNHPSFNALQGVFG